VRGFRVGCRFILLFQILLLAVLVAYAALHTILFVNMERYNELMVQVYQQSTEGNQKGGEQTSIELNKLETEINT